jgi:hypothetical protein
LPWLLTCVLGSSAAAQGVGIPSSRWGLGFGNSFQGEGSILDVPEKILRGVNLAKLDFRLRQVV